jgi:RHS repeat-associated protein
MNGAVVERIAFDAWGARETSNGAAAANVNPAHGDRGYTGHEHLDEIGLVHMNGRIYDPVLARFMSPDPVVGDPSDMQHYNRYAYVANSPLRYTDPSGNCIWDACVFEAFAAIIIGSQLEQHGNKHWRMVGTIVKTVGEIALVEAGIGDFPKPAVAAIASATATAASGGTPEQVLLSAATAAAYSTAGAKWGNEPGKILSAHALIACVSASASGGNCGRAAVIAVANKYATIELRGSGLGKYEMPAVLAVVGGTVSHLGGGKFANGAAQAASAYIYNELMNSDYGGTAKEKTAAIWL